MKIPRKARYGFVLHKVYEFIMENNIKDFPVNPFALAEFMDVPLKSYCKLSEDTGYSVDKIKEKFGKDGVSIFRDGYFSIAYNKKPDVLKRVNFTIMHELGHIYLNHHIDFEKTTLSKNELSRKEYKVLEDEANCFARNVLAPSPIVDSLPRKTKYILENLFNITTAAAKTRLKFLDNDKYHSTISGFKRMREWFEYFISEINNNYFCLDCSTEFVHSNPTYCKICGGSNLGMSINFLGVGKNMFYSKISINEVLGLPEKCPNCFNENIIGQYCQICGKYLVNKCTGMREGEYDQYPDYIRWHEHEGGCGKTLNGDARFCIDCGSTSTFYEERILSTWKEEMEAKEYDEMHAPIGISESPITKFTEKKVVTTVGEVIDISDDDLPF